MRARNVLPILVVVLFLSIGMQSQDIGIHNRSGTVQTGNLDENKQGDVQEFLTPKSDGILSNDFVKQGVIDPVLVEQAGYYTTGSITGRTDTAENIVQNLTIDEANGWVGSVAEVDVTSLDRLYAVNGSLDDGIAGTNQNPSGAVSFYPYGWSASSSAGSNGDDQFAAYEKQSDPYVTVINQALEGGFFNDYYDHFTGSYVIWTQTVQNAPFTTDFVLSFDYLYFSGILSRAGGDDPQGDAWLIVAIDGVIEWNISLLSLSSRNIWNNTGDINLNLPSVGSSFTLGVGIYIQDGMRLYADNDYDNDGVADGLGNVASFNVHLDDISLVGSSPPSFDAVELQFRAGTFTTDIAGSNGVGNASITNTDLWTTDPLTVEILSNTSVRVEYTTRVLSHRFINSSWTTDGSKEGVSFSVSPNQSPRLKLFAYVGIVDPYVDFYVNILHPNDWKNATVYSPFLTDVTENVTISDGKLTVPTEVLDLLGWWEIEFDAPNYIDTLDVEVDDEGVWTVTDMLRPGNSSRVSFGIGTLSESPTIDDAANITWVSPETTWYEQQVTNPSSNIGVSDAVTMGSLNTSAGQWSVWVSWTNGTEIAYGSTNFDLYRTALLTPVYDTLEADFGTVVSNFLAYEDEFTGDNLLETTATLQANWSATTVDFAPNAVRNWWEADFDSTLVEGGDYSVIVNASRPFYDNITASFTIVVDYTTTLTKTNLESENIERDLNQSFEVRFNYTRTNGIGVSGADIEISYMSQGLTLSWSSATDYANGTYSVFMSANASDTYSITLSASKDYHKSASSEFQLEVAEVPTLIQSTNGSSGITEVGEEYRLVLHYTNSTGYSISGASVAVTSVSPSSGITVDISPEEEDGHYPVVLTPSNTGIFTIVLELNRTNFVSKAVTFSLSVSNIDTDLIFTNIGSQPIDVVVNQTFEVRFDYTRLNGTGIVAADITISYFSTEPALSWSSETDHNNGTYTVLIFATSPDTYSITVTASKDLHNSVSDTFDFVVEKVPTQVFSVNGSSGITEVGEQYRLVVHYSNSTGVGISGAILSVVSVSPDTGISIDTFSDDEDGYYSVVITPSSKDIFTIILEIERPDFQSRLVTFSLSVNDIDTTIEFSNVGTLPIGLGLGQTFQVRFDYIQSNLTGIKDANIELTYTSNNEGLSWTSALDYGNGSYSVQISVNITGTYSVLITASKELYTDAFDSFTVIIENIPTQIVLLNGSTDSIQFGSSYDLVFEYVNQSGYGLSGADVFLIDQDPTTGITIETAYDLGDGSYSVTLSPQVADVFNIVLEVNLTNYAPRFLTFTLTVNTIPTVLVISKSSSEIAIDLNQTVVIQFEDEEMSGIAGATIELVSPPDEITASIVTDLGNGTYSITLSSNSIGAYDLLFRAKLANYQTSTEAYSLLVTEIPTEILVEDDISTFTLDYGETQEILLFYRRTDLDNNITSADIEVVSDAINFTVNKYDGYYGIEVTGYEIGRWQLSFSANKSDYRLSSDSVFIVIEEIDTLLEAETNVGTIYFDRSYKFNFTFTFEANQSGIESATVTGSGEAADWANVLSLTQGEYQVTVITEELGTHTIFLEFSKDGFETRTFRLTFDVVQVPVIIIFESGLDGVEGSSTELVVRLEAEDTGLPVTGATVAYRFVDAQGIPGESVPMQEVEEGTYAVDFVVPDAGASYTIQILVGAQNYELTGSDKASVVPEVEFNRLVVRTVNQSLPLILGLIGIFTILVVRSVYKKRRIRENLETLAIKRRFDDAKNNLGIIILHKTSGVPIHSRMLRGGIEEGMISAFITAISNFRSEFKIEGGSEIGKIYPISDIIRVVATENLLIAFVTLDRPSEQQRVKMLALADMFRERFDSEFIEAPMLVISEEVKETFDSAYEDYMDVALLRRYRLDTDEPLSGESRCIEESTDEFEGREFVLEQLVESITECGLDEGKVYRAITDAIDRSVLKMTKERVYTRVTNEDMFIVEVEDLLSRQEEQDLAT